MKLSYKITKKILLLLLLPLLLFFLTYFSLYTIQKNTLSKINSHSKFSCRPIFGIVGAEDIKLSKNDGLAFLSSTDRRAYNKKIDSRGKIYIMDLNQSEPQPIDITPSSPIDFHPIGISLAESEEVQLNKKQNKKITLYAINDRLHALKNRFEIVVFEYTYESKKHTLNYRETLHFNELNYPNAILAIDSKNKFIVSNEFGSKSALGQAIEFLFKQAKSNVVYYDGQRGHILIENLRFANGLEWGPNHEHVFVAESNGRGVGIYKIQFPLERYLNSIKPQLESHLSITGADNLFLEEEGNTKKLWVASHLSTLAFIGNAQDPKNFAPSKLQTIELKKKSSKEPSLPLTFNEAQEVYLNQGDEISAASVAIRYKKHILIGSTFDNKILLCK